MIATRDQFKQWLDRRYAGITHYASALWSVETKQKSQWFVKVKPVSMQRDGRRLQDVYWSWCNAHCQGQILCYYSDFDNNEEWWGFTEYQDLTLWILKWS